MSGKQIVNTVGTSVVGTCKYSYDDSRVIALIAYFMSVLPSPISCIFLFLVAMTTWKAMIHTIAYKVLTIDSTSVHVNLY